MEGLDLLLTPQLADSWEFQDIYDAKYLQTQLEGLIQEAYTKY